MIDNIRIFAADIDGTLVPKGEDLMPITKEALEKLHRDGVKVGLASGRPCDRRVIDKMKDWNMSFEADFVIGMNGGDLYVKGEEEVRHYFPLKKETLREIAEFLWDLDLNLIVYEKGYDHILAKRIDMFLEDSRKRNHSIVEVADIDRLCKYDTGKLEVHYDESIEEEVMKVVNAHKCDDWNCVKTFFGTIEFTDPRIHKGIALQKYADLMNIPMEEVIAFGDMDNDVGLVDTAGWGVALINGCDATKAVAQAITEYPVTEDGVGRYLEDHWFNKWLN